MPVWEALACARVVFKIDASDGRVVLDPDEPPLLRPAGNCAIAVRTSHRHETTWNTIRAVTEVLLARCVSIPIKGSTGGRATAQPVKKLPRQLFGKSSSPLPHMHFSSQSMYKYLCRPLLISMRLVNRLW